MHGGGGKTSRSFFIYLCSLIFLSSALLAVELPSSPTNSSNVTDLRRTLGNTQAKVTLPQQSTPRSGWFFGGGIGSAMERFKDDKEKTQISFYPVVAQANIGGYTYLKDKLGLRYYYSYEMNFNPHLERRQPFITYINSEATSLTITTHTLNLDVILNSYVSEKVDFGFLLGVGAGMRFGQVTTKNYENGGNLFLPDVDRPYNAITTRLTSGVQGWTFKLNAGIRTLIHKQYGFEILSSFSPLPLVFYPLYPNLKNSSRLAHAFSLTLNFVMEL